MNKIIGNDSSRPALIAIAPAPDERHCQIKALVANVRQGLQLIVATASQLSKTQRWFALGALHRRANIGLRAQTEPRVDGPGDGVTEENRINEFARMLQAMQTSDKNGVATSEGWTPGADMIAPPPPKTADAADKRTGEGDKTIDWCLLDHVVL